jgi:hypothetical protein
MSDVGREADAFAPKVTIKGQELPGDCVDMPALAPRNKFNPRPGRTTMLDSLISAPGANLWTPIEACLSDLGPEFPTDGCDGASVSR